MKQLLFLLSIIPSLMYAQKQYDVVIIGGGPSGLGAAIVCQELGFQTLIVDEKESLTKPLEPPKPPETPPPSAEPQTPTNPENPPPPPLPPPPTAHPGGETPQWVSLKKTMKESYIKAGGELIQKKVISFSRSKSEFKVFFEKDVIYASAVVIATGKHPKKLFPIRDPFGRVLQRLWNTKALSSMDSVFLIGQGEALFEQAAQAASVTKNVTLFPFKTNKMDLKGLLESFPFITVVNGAVIENIFSTKDSVTLQYVENRIKNFKKASYIILADEKEPTSELARDLQLDSSKNIITTNDTFETSTSGIFACGEVTHSRPLTGIQAIAEGQQAGWAAVHYLVENGVSPQMQEKPLLARRG